LERIRYRRCSQNLLSVCDFRENRCSGSHSSLRGVKWMPVLTFHTCFSIWVQFGMRDLHIMLLGVCGFRGNRRREDLTCLVGINKVAAKPYDVFKVKDAVIKSIYGVTECTIGSLAKPVVQIPFPLIWEDMFETLVIDLKHRIVILNHWQWITLYISAVPWLFIVTALLGVCNLSASLISNIDSQGQ